jgi:hypothetical protein
MMEQSPHGTRGEGLHFSREDSMPTTIMTEADVKQKLEHEGYTQITEVRREKDGYTAKAMKGGKQVTLDIDSSGKVKAK